MPGESGPYLVASLICQQVLIEKDEVPIRLDAEFVTRIPFRIIY